MLLTLALSQTPIIKSYMKALVRFCFTWNGKVTGCYNKWNYMHMLDRLYVLEICYVQSRDYGNDLRDKKLFKTTIYILYSFAVCLPF